MERHLAAILSADVAGYSKLVEDDDEATVRTLQGHREIMRMAINGHKGRVVDAPGDNLLAEFPSVIEAVRCAIEIQTALRAENANATRHRRMAFRIGISVGDVVMQDAQLFGDGVNIAARVQAIADPGGICLSSSAYEQCENKLDLDLEFLGERTVKNISKPVPIWRVRLEDSESSTITRETADDTRDTALPTAIFMRRAITALLVLTIGIAAFVALRDHKNTPTNFEQRESAQANQRPAIIVLPFENLSDAPDQAYFSNGITEDIITDLSKIDTIFVVPSASTKRFKDQAVATDALQEEFGIRYLLEGSVRKAGNQIRISARLVDVVDDRNLWSERFDRPLVDIFALQDDIRKKIFTALRVNLTDEEQKRFIRARTNSLEAYDFSLRAQDMTQRARREFKPELIDKAAALYQRALDLDPEYAAAYADLGLNRWLGWFYGWSEQSDATRDTLRMYTEKAMALDDSDPHLLKFMIRGLLFSGDYDGAIERAAEYVRLMPSDPEAHRTRAYALAFAGEYGDAAESADRAVELYPRFPIWGYWTLGLVYHAVGRTDEAVEAMETATTIAPNYLTNQIMLTVIYSDLGEVDKAQRQAKEILRISPAYKAETAAKMYDFKHKTEQNGFVDALRKAGIP